MPAKINSGAEDPLSLATPSICKPNQPVALVTAPPPWSLVPNTWGHEGMTKYGVLSPDFGSPRNFTGLNAGLFIATLYASTARDTCMTKIVSGCKSFH